MRNTLDQGMVRTLGHIPYSIRGDLCGFLDQWYKQEQDRLTTLSEESQLRQAQGAAQVLRDISAVLKNPEAYANTAGPRPTQLP